MKQIKSKIILPALFIASSILASCNSSTPVNAISDETTINNVLLYSLDYQVNIPGKQISYNHMWEGIDTKNQFGPNFTEENRLYTYLTEYGETEKYYFVYVKKDGISTLNSWISSYLESGSESNDCKFQKDENVIDGKYVYAAEKNEIKDFLVTSSNVLDQKYEINNYKMALCLEMKTVTILQNSSTKENINKKLPLFNRAVMKYDTSKGTLERASQGNFDETYTNNIYSYLGKRLETYPKTFESKECLYSPLMGFTTNLYKTVRAPISKNRILLPRISSEYDLLSKEELPSTLEDVYQEHKGEFLDAFIEYKNNESSDNAYGYYDFDKVQNILK